MLWRAIRGPARRGAVAASLAADHCGSLGRVPSRPLAPSSGASGQASSPAPPSRRPRGPLGLELVRTPDKLPLRRARRQPRSRGRAQGCSAESRVTARRLTTTAQGSMRARGHAGRFDSSQRRDESRGWAARWVQLLDVLRRGATGAPGVLHSGDAPRRSAHAACAGCALARSTGRKPGSTQPR